MQPDPEILNRWSASAPYWEKHRAVISRLFAPVVHALAEDARIAAGHLVLDIATGPGEPALSLAPLVEPGGAIVGIDPVAEMVAAARRAAEQLGLTNARFEIAGAGDLPFPAATFDAVVSRFGVMFFPSPAGAVREILRVLRPGCKFALAAWHSAETNPFFTTFSRVIDRYIEPAPVAPDAPDAFRFASPGKLRDVLVEAGAAAPAERLLRFPIEAPVSPEEFFTLRCEMSERLRDKIAHLSAKQFAEVKAQVLEALREYTTAGAISFPAEVLIVSGAR